MITFNEYIKMYYGRNATLDNLTDEQYEIVSAAYEEERAEDPDNFE